MIIPMFTSTRPQLHTIGHKVHSLLSEPPLSTCETWLLPQIYVLCMTRNQEGGHGTARSVGQDGEDTKYKEQEKLLEKLQAPDVRHLPDDRRLPGDRTTGGHRTSVTSTTEGK